MVSREPFDQYGGLVDELGLELVLPEAGERSMKCGLGQRRFGSRAIVAASIPVTSAAIAT